MDKTLNSGNVLSSAILYQYLMKADIIWKIGSTYMYKVETEKKQHLT